MSRPVTQNQPTVEELLVSIRKAIHDDKAGFTGAKSSTSEAGSDQKKTNITPVSGSMKQMRVSLQPDDSLNHSTGQQQNENFNKLRKQLHELGATAVHQDTAFARQQSHNSPQDPKPAMSKPAASLSLPRMRSKAASGFAGILSGDANLEEALAKLKRAGLSEGNEKSNQETPLQQTELRTGEVETDEVEYVSEYESDLNYADSTQADQISQSQYPQDTTYQDIPYQAAPYEDSGYEDSFSPQTRHNYIEPAQPATPPAYVPVERPQTPTATEMENVPQANPHLTSPQSAAETAAAFNHLAETIVGQATTGERSIDEITRELLRPMLRSWLDENLPRMVERLVREEIERVARWGGK